MIFEIFDSSVSKDNSISRDEFMASVHNLKLIKSSLVMTEDDFNGARQNKAKEITFPMFSQYLIRKNYITVLVQEKLLLDIFNCKVNVRANPLDKTLPVGMSPEEVFYRN